MRCLKCELSDLMSLATSLSRCVNCDRLLHPGALKMCKVCSDRTGKCEECGEQCKFELKDAITCYEKRKATDAERLKQPSFSFAYESFERSINACDAIISEMKAEGARDRFKTIADISAAWRRLISVSQARPGMLSAKPGWGLSYSA